MDGRENSASNHVFPFVNNKYSWKQFTDITKSIFIGRGYSALDNQVVRSDSCDILACVLNYTDKH